MNKQHMSTVHSFAPGDFLIFQLESGYALLRVLGTDEIDEDTIWHVAAYADLFLDPETVDSALDYPADLTLDRSHIALTNRAFESTQVARMKNVPLNELDLEEYESWKRSGEQKVHDRSIRLLLGLR